MSDTIVFRLLETHRCRDLFPYNCRMTFTTVISLTFAVKTSSIAEIYTREFTYDSCIPTIRTDLIPHAANK